MKKLILLGATGSIGTQCIDVVLEHPELFQVEAMACGTNIKELEKIMERYPYCQTYNVSAASDAKYLQAKYPDYTITHGMSGLLALLTLDADIVVNALVGFVGLKPTLYAMEQGKDVALANKESLVVGGELVKQTMQQFGVNMYPIDSEHSAIFQCLQGNERRSVKRLIISASGGSFRDLNREQLHNVTRAQALNHPNWSMGSRITIDSATMMNKGFEVIEAYYLFGLDFNQIDVILHRESIVHSLVEYQDKSMIAQLGSADMRVPILYALSYPKRESLSIVESLDLCKLHTLHFETVSFERYPLLKLAYEAGERGGNSGAIINAADEIAVALFLEGKITFLQIEELIFQAYREIRYIPSPSYEEIEWTDKITRKYIRELGEAN